MYFSKLERYSYLASPRLFSGCTSVSAYVGSGSGTGARIPYFWDILRHLLSLRHWTRLIMGGIGGCPSGRLFPEHIQTPIHTKVGPEVLGLI